MGWVSRVHLLAETDRLLHYRARVRHRKWTAGHTARKLGVSRATLSMCMQLEGALDRFPHLKDYSTIRNAYNAWQKLKKERTHGAEVSVR